MKKFGCFLVIMLISSVFLFTASAEELPLGYTVKCVNGEYMLLNGDEEIVKNNSILPIISEIGEGYVYFENVRVYEEIEISNTEMTLSGNIFLDDSANISVGDGGRLLFDHLDVKMLSDVSSVNVFGGELTLDSAVISSLSECAVSVKAGKLTILNESVISGRDYDISSDSEISFLDKENAGYTGNKDFRVKYLGDGQKLSDIVSVSKGETPHVILYAPSGEELPIHIITFINHHGDSFSEYRLSGEKITLPDVEKITGYSFWGWTHDGEILDDTVTASSDAAIYAEYKLDAPVFCVRDIEFLYDGQTRALVPSNIDHPLLSEGTVYYNWYRGGTLISDRSELSVRNVTDSGNYTLEVIFEHDDERSVFSINDITVNIEPRKLFVKYEDDNFVIYSGEVIDGDNVNIETDERDGILYAKTENPNYSLDFSPQIIKSRMTEITILAWTLVVLAIICAVAFFVFWSAEKDFDISSVNRARASSLDDSFISTHEDEKSLYENFFGVEAVRADELLSNRMAKNMITNGGIVVTDGNGTAEVSLGIINDNFSYGDFVDINSLKKLNIVSQDVSKLNITSVGVIDKPLKIMANEFDITAVKMISLSGGEAIKVKSRRKA